MHIRLKSALQADSTVQATAANTYNTKKVIPPVANE